MVGVAHGYPYILSDAIGSLEVYRDRRRFAWPLRGAVSLSGGVPQRNIVSASCYACSLLRRLVDLLSAHASANLGLLGLSAWEEGKGFL